jgi:hypothetical protein
VNDHIPDPTKMIQDTPRTDEQINGKPCTRFEMLAGDSLRNASVPSEFARTLERELNTAQDRIKRLDDIISRAAYAFFRDGSDIQVANEMLTILEEVRKP